MVTSPPPFPGNALMRGSAVNPRYHRTHCRSVRWRGYVCLCECVGVPMCPLRGVLFSVLRVVMPTTYRNSPIMANLPSTGNLELSLYIGKGYVKLSCLHSVVLTVQPLEFLLAGCTCGGIHPVRIEPASQRHRNASLVGSTPVFFPREQKRRSLCKGY